MSWKPSRNSGVMFDKYDQQECKYKNLLNDEMEQANPPTYKQITVISKYLYFLVSASVKKHNSISNNKKNINKNDIESSILPYYIKIFKCNPKHVYKPLNKILNQ